MSIPPGPRADFVLIQSQAVLGLAKAGLDRPASTRRHGQRRHRGTDRREHEIRGDPRGGIHGATQQYPARPARLPGTVDREVGPLVQAGPLAARPRAQALPLGGGWKRLSDDVPNRDLTYAPPDILLATDRQHIA